MNDETPATPPTLSITWNADEQTVGLKFQPSEFRNWQFVLAVLEMAKQAAEMNLRMAHAQAMQAAQQSRPVLPNGRPLSGLRG